MNASLRLVRPSLHALCGGLLTLAALSLAMVAHAQTVFYDTDGDRIGVVDAAYVGYSNRNPFTITADSGTGVLYSAFVYNKATLNFTGGVVRYYNLSAADSSTVNFSGGSVGSTLFASQNSVVNLSGGSVGGNLYISQNATVNFTGGSAGGIYTQGGTVNYKGGSTTSSLWDITGGRLNLFGTNLAATLVSSSEGNSTYALSGFLNDGTDLTGKNFRLFGNANYTLNNSAPPPPPSDVPEPGVVAFASTLGVALCGLIVRRRF